MRSLLKLDEDALKNAWIKASHSTRQGGDKDARLQYLSWRIWHLKRRNAQVEREQRAERESYEPGSPDYSSDEGSGPTRPSMAHSTVSSGQVSPRRGPSSALGHTTVSPNQDSTLTPATLKNLAVKIKREPVTFDTVPEDFLGTPTELTPRLDPSKMARLYVVMISLHGLVRGDRMELGRDSDTGGQVKYVVELAKAMSLHPFVYRVDLLTRMIKDPMVDASYGEPEECLATGQGELGGAYIVRLPCGPPDKYVRKELLWPHVREFADRGIAHVTKTLSALSGAGKRCELSVIHGHYADAGEVAVLMASTLDVPMVMTGHSLGRNKLEHLLRTMTRAEIEESYAIFSRIEAEEHALDVAAIVFTSTQEEVDNQWGTYDGYSANLARILRFRRPTGRHMPGMRVIPPGLDFSNLKVEMPEDPVLKEFEEQRNAMAAMEFVAPVSPLLSMKSTSSGSATPVSNKSQSMMGAEVEKQLNLMSTEGPPIWGEMSRFLRNPLKPAVLAMSRPDTKKNITTLVRAFGEHSLLRELANLVLIMGNRDNIDSMPSASEKVLTQVLKLIDAYDLYGSVAYPKHHTQDDISDIYNFAKHTRGVFTNIALQEPFGLTVIEAAAHGVPTVATMNGGPVDIMATLHHGVVVNPTDSEAVAQALVTILTHPDQWDRMSRAGVDNIMAYSWPSHCKRYLEAMHAERKYITDTKKRHDRTMSGFLTEKKTLSVAELAAEAGDASPSETVDMFRCFSVPHPTHILKPSKAMAASNNPVPRTITNLSTDDLALLNTNANGMTSSFADLAALADKQAAACGRSQFMVVPLDSDVVAENTVKALKSLLLDMNDDRKGVGVLSMLGFESTKLILKESRVDLNRIDFMVCNAGADVWWRLLDDSWEADEGYEDLIDFKWDRLSLWRTLNKIISAPVENRRLPLLKELLYNVGKGSSLDAGVHPRHICLELDMETQSILSSGMGPKARQVVGLQLSTAATSRLKRRLRSKGFRATFTLQAVPQGPSDFVSILHVTPVRASRSLALRYIAHKLGYDMGALVLVIPVAEIQQDTISLYTNDLGDLLGGMQRVVCLSGGGGGAELPHGGTVLQVMGVDLKPYINESNLGHLKILKWDDIENGSSKLEE